MTLLLSPSRASVDCLPRLATRRRPERTTYGAQIAEVARQIGPEPAPHQRLIWDVGTELLSDRPAFREVLLSIGRQDAKTTSLLAVALWRCLIYDPRPYGAQREQVLVGLQDQERAGRLILQDWLPLIEASPFRSLIAEVTRRAGAHRILFSNGSSIASMTSNAHGIRSRTKVGLVIMDEAYAHEDDTAESAARATMLHRVDGQIWIASNWTKPTTAPALWWRAKYAHAKSAVEADADRGIAAFDWGMRKGLDPRDPATWTASKPLLAAGVIDLATLRAELPPAGADTSTFETEYLNAIPEEGSGSRAIEADSWSAVCSSMIAPSGGIRLGVDSNPERTWTAVAASDAAGRCELIAFDRGSAWIVDWLAAREYIVALDGNGPLAHLIDELRKRGVVVEVADGRDLCDAAQQLLDAIALEEPFVRGDYRLDEAVPGVKLRKIGQRTALGRGEDITQVISPVVALSLARWAARKGEDEEEYAWSAG